jgi:hypothetical protein
VPQSRAHRVNLTFWVTTLHLPFNPSIRMHCVPDRFSVGKFLVEKNVIQDQPAYQRESGIWSDEKQQLFIDSLLNKYDIPKLYLHDLRGKDPKFKFAVVDGKQRLHAVWRFLNSNLALASDFELYEPEGRTPPLGGLYFKDLSPDWQDLFKSILLDVVLIQNADEDDIEDLFSRLNNGEPLNAAEKRNAMGGDMTKLIRDVAGLDFFKERLGFSNRRYQHMEVAAKLLLIENAESSGAEPFCDLKKRFLDKLVRDGMSLSKAARDGLQSRVEKQLRSLARVFSKNDPLLGKQAYPPLYYLFVKIMERDYAHKDLYSRIKSFLPQFHERRAANLLKSEEDRDSVLIEFGRLMQQGTNDLNSLKERVATLRRYFLLEFPDTAVRDRKRTFSEDERLVIWLRAGKKCQKCGSELRELSDMQADHHRQWAHGGETSLANGRALCESCNLEEAKKVK